MRTAAAVPPVSALPLPADAEILGDSTDCASGGCWMDLTVRPPAGQTPEALAEEMGATPQVSIPGDFLDPRTVWVTAKPAGSLLLVTFGYESDAADE